MKIVLLDATKQENETANTVRKALEAKYPQISHFALENMNVQPCRSCGSCGIKTPGRCIVNDAMQDVLHGMANSELIVMLTPVRFGGYASTLKKAVDRFMPFGLPLYYIEGDHFLHPMRYQNKYLLGIGILEAADEDQGKNFRRLVAQNALNFQFKNKTLLFADKTDGKSIFTGIENALMEVQAL